MSHVTGPEIDVISVIVNGIQRNSASSTANPSSHPMRKRCQRVRVRIATSTGTNAMSANGPSSVVGNASTNKSADASAAKSPAVRRWAASQRASGRGACDSLGREATGWGSEEASCTAHRGSTRRPR